MIKSAFVIVNDTVVNKIVIEELDCEKIRAESNASYVILEENAPLGTDIGDHFNGTNFIAQVKTPPKRYKLVEITE